jgi:hypothetical protein
MPRSSLLTEILPAEAGAIEAVVARYQRVAPAVTRFARSLSGDERLRLRLGSQASASPGEVVVDPGVFQAAYARQAPVTPAEVALASALHEVVHLVATSLEERRPLPPEWFPDVTDTEPLPDEPVPLLDALTRAGGPAAEAMFLAVEDARQETQSLQAYPGARSVLADLYGSAVPSALGRARPMGQFALACFLAVAGYQEARELRGAEPRVAAALADEDAVAAVAAARAAAGPWEAAYASMRLLSVARYHGLLTEASPGETARARQARQADESEQITSAVDAVRLVTPVLRDAESYERTRGATVTMGAPEGRPGESHHASDPGTDQILRVSEAPEVYLPTGQGGRLIVSPLPERFRLFSDQGHQALEAAGRAWAVGQRHVSGELYPLFAANQRRGLRSGYDAGDLSPYAALFLGAGLYQRMFERRDLPTRRAYAVSLLVDGSASMLQARPLPGDYRAPWPMAAATLGAWTLALLCDELQVEFEVALFNRAFAARPDDTEAAFVERLHSTRGALRRSQGSHADRLTRTVNHYLVKAFDQHWPEARDQLAGLFWTAAHPADAAAAARRDSNQSPPVSMFEKAANVDEFNVTYAVERLARRNAQVRLLVTLADGMTRGSVEALSAAVGAAEATGTVVLGIGIGDDTVASAYSRHQVVTRPDALARAMVDGVRAALRRSIALFGGATWWAHESRLYDEPPPRRTRA